MKPMHFSEEVESLEKKLEPYFSKEGGLKPNVSDEIKKIYEEYQKRVQEEMWFDD